MRTKLIESNKPERYIHMVRNVDQGSVTSITTITNSIPAGTPLILNVGATAEPSTYQNALPAGFEDGLQVILPVSAANGGQGLGAFALNFLHYGVAVNDILYNQLGEAMVFGVYPYALFVRATRAASTNSWTSSQSYSGWEYLSIDSINNAFTTYASAAAATSNATTPVAPLLPIYLLDSISSIAASSSATTDTRTAILTKQRVFIREM
jgi:hypothetical protein